METKISSNFRGVTITRFKNRFETLTHFDSSAHAVVHYTCNAPPQEVLDRQGISAVGAQYSSPERTLDAREVLQIPARLYKKFGLTVEENQALLILNSEFLLKKLTNK